MSSICIGVYKNERRTAKYTGGGAKFAKMVGQQSFWFLASFYVTWVPYLALQYLWSSGKAYGNYGFILYAGISVPLQGWDFLILFNIKPFLPCTDDSVPPPSFWNFLVYIRPRYLNKRTAFAGSRLFSLSSFISSKRLSNTDHKEEKPGEEKPSMIGTTHNGQEEKSEEKWTLVQ